ncbi:MAG: Uma2 family endonuclease [Cyanobacteria bacterium P01_D01_bin.73]
MVSTASRRYTVDDYLRQEAIAATKHEYRDGEIIEMPGGTANHSLIALYFALYLKQALIAANISTVKLFNSDMQLWLPESNSFTYPDGMAVKGDPAYRDDSQTAITNPCLIVEVLPDSTAAYDRGEKFQKYGAIAEFEEYLLFDQNQYRVEQFCRQSEDEWVYRAIAGKDAKIQLRSLGVEVAIADIYEDVSLKEN